ncbi:hypothetical protein [Bradyrhizobium sp. Gha]|nr:hypothetical protein [Bradyrhizobium sp. Gha]
MIDLAVALLLEDFCDRLREKIKSRGFRTLILLFALGALKHPARC